MPKTPKPQRPRKGQYADNPEEALDRASSDILRKVPPHSFEAEQAVLGGVFQSEAMFHQLVDIISPDDFYSPVHRDIFKAFTQLYDDHQPIDTVTVANQLSKNGTLDTVGGPVYLAELSDSVISASNALYHAQIVRDKCILRELIDISSGIIANCFSSADVGEVLDESEKEIFRIAQSKEMRGMQSSGQLVPKVFDELTARFNNKSVVTGIQTHYHEFDNMTAGLQNSDLIIIAGRPSMGKTAFALNVALRAAARSECPTAIFSLEMSMEQLMTRLLAVQSKVELSNLRTGYLDDSDWNKLYEGADVLSKAPIFIDGHPGALHPGTPGTLPPPQGRAQPRADRHRLPPAHALQRPPGLPRAGDLGHLPSPQGPGQGAERAGHRPIPAQPQGRGAHGQAAHDVGPA